MASTLSLFLTASCHVGAGPGRRGTVIYASGSDLQSINPLIAVHPLAKAVQKHLLFLTLATYDSTMQPMPRLASWQWHGGRTALVFHVRQDVWWHDGIKTSAADVAWTLDMARAPEVAYPRARDFADVLAVTQLDSFSVEIRFRNGQPVFPDVFTDIAILPAHRFRGTEATAIRRAPFNAHPVGNGPFEFVEYLPRQRWVFRRHSGFPIELGTPQIERFVITVVDEPATKLAALTSGELDFAGISPAHATFVRDDKRLRAVDFPVLFVYAVIWNLRREPFTDVRVRRALTQALDRQLIVDAYLYGFGAVADGPVPPEHPWFVKPVAVPHDPAGAARALERIGWRLGPDGIRQKDGRRLAFDLLTVGSGDNALEQMIQAQLHQVGVEVTIRQRELGSFLSTVQGSARDFDAIVTGIPGDLSLSYVLAMFDGRDAGPLAYPGLQSGAFEAAADAVRDAQNAAELEHAWSRVQTILVEEHPTTWLYHARGLQGMSNRVRAPATDLRGELASVARWTIVETERDP